MNCNKCKQLLLSYLDNELNPLDIVSIEDHLSACPGCREDLEALAETQRELRHSLKSMAAEASPSSHAMTNIKQRLAADKGHNASILSRWRARLQEGTGMFKSPNFKWQMAGTIVVGVLLVLSLTIPSLLTESPASASQLTKFSSYDELKEFVEGSSQSYYQVKGNSTFAFEDMDGIAAADSEARDYSETNIQVAGVDEADIVKTDGEFIYLASDSRVIIVRADPANAQVLKEINLDRSIAGLFINGDRLVVIYQNYGNWDGLYYGNMRLFIPESADMLTPRTYINVYDVSDREKPVLTREMSIDGNYFSSRMIGDYVYMIVNASAFEQDDEIQLPVIHLDDSDVKINATDIYYTGITDNYYSFTTIVAVNIKKDNREPEYETLLLGATSNLYVSLNNIYVTTTTWRENSEKTAIHRIRASGGDIEYMASGEVPGSLVNQFSMDEYDGYFRVATTTSGWGEVRTSVVSPDVLKDSNEIILENISTNHVYVLDMDLTIVGKVQNLAPGEEIYSARFMGKKAYIVTFRKIDPLLVIDLANPYSPEVLGQLKITGYSDYLHPYDDNHILGIGKETIAAEQGDFAWYQGVKISLFDVSDVTNPVEITKYEIGDRGTDSPVLQDHKALLFDKTKNLLVIPVWVAEIDEAQYLYSEIPPYAYGEIVWQGAYVFDISLDNGLQLKGRISHYDDLSQTVDYYYGPETIQRSLYIDNVLYTISEAKIGMNDLVTLEEIGEIVLP